MPHSKGKLIFDITQAVCELKEFTNGKSYQELEEDRKLQLIVEREFEIIGEALYRLKSLDFEAFNRIKDGHKIIGTRNILAHGYDIIDYKILWDAITHNLDTLLQELERFSA